MNDSISGVTRQELHDTLVDLIEYMIDGLVTGVINKDTSDFYKKIARVRISKMTGVTGD